MLCLQWGSLLNQRTCRRLLLSQLCTSTVNLSSVAGRQPDQVQCQSIVQFTRLYDAEGGHCALAALAHQADFDVCWCKGSVSERIFEPLVARLKSLGATITGSTFVNGMQTDAAGRVTGVVATDKQGKVTTHKANAVVFAIGIKGKNDVRTAGNVMV